MVNVLKLLFIMVIVLVIKLLVLLMRYWMVLYNFFVLLKCLNGVWWIILLLCWVYVLFLFVNKVWFCLVRKNFGVMVFMWMFLLNFVVILLVMNVVKLEIFVFVVV